MQQTRPLFGVILCEDAYSKKAQATRPDDTNAAYLAENAGRMQYLRPLEKEATS